MSKKFDEFEWTLICLLIGLFLTGVIVAFDRHENKIAKNEYQRLEKLGYEKSVDE